MKAALALHPKVAAPLLATWVTTILFYSLHQWAHVDLPLVVAAAVTSLVAFGAGWAAPNLVDEDPALPAAA